MKKTVLCLTVLATASVSMAAFTNAPYTGAWHKVWDFSSDAAGWTLQTSGTGVAQWSANHGGSLFFSNPGTGHNGWAKFDATTLGTNFNTMGSGAGKTPFIMECEILLPYRSDLPPAYAHPGGLQAQGVAAVRPADNTKGPSVVGSSTGAGAADRTWDNTNRTLGFTFQKQGSSEMQTNTWFKMQLDYGKTIAGKWNAWVYNPFPNGRDPAGGWMQVTGAGGYSVNPGDTFTTLLTGWTNGAALRGQAAWGDSYVKNVKLLVPEPTTLALLVLGFVGLIRRR